MTREMERFYRGPAAGLAPQAALLALLSAITGLGAAGWLAGAAYGLGVCLALRVALRRSGRRGLGPADQVTLARAVLTGGITALVVDAGRGPAAIPAILALATVALLLDAVDGRVARRTGTCSPLGARFDMEVDAFLILVLSMLAAESLGPWVLTIGGMRYAFAAASRALRWLAAPLPHSIARKTVAALQGVFLVIVISGALTPPATTLVALAALATLTWSFTRDIHWLHAHRPIALPVRRPAHVTAPQAVALERRHPVAA